MKQFKYILLFLFLLLLKPIDGFPTTTTKKVLQDEKDYFQTLGKPNANEPLLSAEDVSKAEAAIARLDNVIRTSKSHKINAIVQDIKTLDNTVLSNIEAVFRSDLNENYFFLNLFDTAPNSSVKLKLVQAYKKIREAIPLTGGTTKFALDPETINKVSDLIRDGSVFRSKMSQYGLNWEDELSTILNKNRSLKCTTCGSGFATRPNMVDFLSDVEFYVNHYDINGVGNKFYRWIKRINIDETTMLGGETLPVLEEMYQTLYYIRKKNITNIIDFGSTFPQGTKQFDLFFGAGKYAELKNVNFTNISTLSPQTIDQVIHGYFKNINALTDFDWIAYFPKLKANGWETIEIAETNLKQLWKKAFYDASTNQITAKGQELFDVIWNNQNLRNSLFTSTDDAVSAFSEFETMINTMDNKLFGFIKVE